MPRLSQGQPKYRKHKHSGQAVVTLGGRDHYLGPHGSAESKRRYDRLIAEWLQSDRCSLGSNDGIAVSELCVRYLRFARGYYVKDGKCTGVVPAIKACIKYVRTLYGREPAAIFGPLALKAIRQRMIDDGLSRKYINDHVARIKRMYRWGVGEELIPPEAFQSLSSVSGLTAGRTEARETDPVEPVEDATVEATLPHLPELVADIVRLQRLTGMRPAEVCDVRPCDVDRTGDVWFYRPAKHKTQHRGRARVVCIPKAGQEILLKYLARDPEMFCFRPCDSEAKRLAAASAARKTPLSCGNRPGTNRKRRVKRKPGEHYDTCSYRRAITRACEKAFPAPMLAGKREKDLSIEDATALMRWRQEHHWAPNQLRHTFATEVRRLYGLEAAQVLLGHSSADVTQVYAERDLQLGVRVAKAMDSKSA